MESLSLFKHDAHQCSTGTVLRISLKWTDYAENRASPSDPCLPKYTTSHSRLYIGYSTFVKKRLMARFGAHCLLALGDSSCLMSENPRLSRPTRRVPILDCCESFLFQIDRFHQECARSAKFWDLHSSSGTFSHHDSKVFLVYKITKCLFWMHSLRISDIYWRRLLLLLLMQCLSLYSIG